MVKEIQKQDKVYYLCGICKLVYPTADIAAECEQWCKEHKSCNMDIIKQRVEL